MKKFLFLATLFTLSTSLFAQPSGHGPGNNTIKEINTATLDHACALDGVPLKPGTVSIGGQEVVGKVSCLMLPGFKAKEDLCFRFERFMNINDIALVMRKVSNLTNHYTEDYVDLSNIPASNGAVMIKEIKKGFRKYELACTFYNVNWKN